LARRSTASGYALGKAEARRQAMCLVVKRSMAAGNTLSEQEHGGRHTLVELLVVVRRGQSGGEIAAPCG
jgi:hypothetical protein